MVTIEPSEHQTPACQTLDIESKLPKQLDQPEEAHEEDDDEVQFENLYDDDDDDSYTQNFISRGVIKLRQIGYKLVTHVSSCAFFTFIKRLPPLPVSPLSIE